MSEVARVRSLVVRPERSSDLCFGQDGILSEMNVRVGDCLADDQVQEGLDWRQQLSDDVIVGVGVPVAPRRWLPDGHYVLGSLRHVRAETYLEESLCALDHILLSINQAEQLRQHHDGFVKVPSGANDNIAYSAFLDRFIKYFPSGEYFNSGNAEAALAITRVLRDVGDLRYAARSDVRDAAIRRGKVGIRAAIDSLTGHFLTAPWPGRVSAVYKAVGEYVRSDEKVLRIESLEATLLVGVVQSKAMLELDQLYTLIPEPGRGILGAAVEVALIGLRGHGPDEDEWDVVFRADHGIGLPVNASIAHGTLAPRK